MILSPSCEDEENQACSFSVVLTVRIVGIKTF